MATDLASLVIGLRADVATLQSDLGKANALHQRYAKDAASSWNSAAADIGKALGVAVSAIAGIGATMAKQAIDAADGFNKMSQKVGISVESLSALSVQAKLSDVSVDQLQTGLAKLARNAADAASGGKQQAAAFQALGVTLKDANGNLRSTEELLGDVAAKFSSYGDSASKTALAQQVFGKSGAELIPLLNQLGTEGFAKAREEAERYGAVISGDTAAASEHFNDNLTKLKLETQGLANAFVAQLLPSLNKLTDGMVSAGQTTGQYGESASTLVNIVKGVTFAFLALGESIRAVVNIAAASGDTLVEIMSLPAKAGAALADGGLGAAKQSIADSLIGIKSAWSSASTGVGDAIAGIKKDFNDLFGTFSNVSSGANTTAKSVGALTAPLIKSTDATKKAKEETAQYSDALRKAAGAMQAIQGISARLGGDISDIVARMRGADDAQITYNKSIRDIADAYQSLLELGPPTAEAVAAVGEATRLAGEKMDLTRAFDAQRESMQRYQDELRKTQDMWGDFADAVFDAVTKSGSFLKNLLNNLKSVVEQMLKEWFRTRVIGMFTGGGGGGGGVGALASLGMASIGGGGDAFNWTQGASGTEGATANFGTSTGGISLFDAGKKFWGGFESGFSSSSTASSNMFGTYTPDYGAGTYAPSALGYGVAAAGGIYAGYNRYQQSAGGAAGIAGAAAYGYGTYAATIGLSAAATGGIAAGFAAIPVVGWIAIAAMLIDKFSGGKLFGTKGQFNFGEQATTVDASGATVTAGYDLKGQKALFGGSTHTWKDLPVAQEAIDAANAFFQQLKNGTETFAKEFGKTAGDIIGGQFIQTFDKKGNVTANTSTVLGQTYNEDSAHFQERLVAENELAVLTQFDSKLGEAIDKYRADADQLYAITGDLAAAQKGFNEGLTLLALGSDQSTSALLHLAETTSQIGESIDQTLQRILQAQAAYDQFVAQFKPATNYVDDFEGALSGINQQLIANIKQANALAVAAGASGASEKDLANIHAYAAQQAAAAIKALESSAQSLAFQLGLTTTGSLDDVSGEIAALQAKANGGASSVQSFGNAISAVAQKAADAMNLLLGDLSPLNDQQKLQTALQGLRAGTATQDQVLQIGRRLYASSQQYTDLFNMVRSMGPGAQISGGGGASGVSHGGLSAAEQKRLSDLLKEQQQLQAAQQYQQYQTLAQQIAEIAAAKGEDWRQVVSDMGINIADFEKGLKLTDAQTDDLIKHQQDMLDSNNENTKSLIDAIYDIGDQITVAVGGTPSGHSHHASDPGSDSSPSNHRGGHSQRSRDYETGQTIGRGVRDALTSGQPRSGRARARA